MTGTPQKKKASSARAPATTDAQRRAAVILEVLAGIRTAQEAARLLKISPNSYYIAERKALSGLVAACEPATRRGPAPSVERQIHQLERALARCQRECQRQAALVRATQRAVGLSVKVTTRAGLDDFPAPALPGFVRPDWPSGFNGTMHPSDSLLSFASLACEACRAYSHGHDWSS